MGCVDLGLVGEQPQAPGSVVVTDRIFGVVRQLLVKPDRVFAQQQQQLVEGKLGALRRGMPRRAGGQFVAFQQNRVGPTLLASDGTGRTARRYRRQ